MPPFRPRLVPALAVAALVVPLLAVAGPASAAAPACAPVEVVNARATAELPGTGTLLGPIGAFITQQVDGATSYPLPYDAGLLYPTSVAGGVGALVDHLNSSARTCPRQKYVLMGYSQGANVVGDALLPAAQRLFPVLETAPSLTPAASRQIAAVVLFGDPRFNGRDPFDAGSFARATNGIFPRPAGALAAYEGRIRNFCNTGDVFCQLAGLDVLGHFTYWGDDSTSAAFFVSAKLREAGIPVATRRLTATASRAADPSTTAGFTVLGVDLNPVANAVESLLTAITAPLAPR